LTLPLLLPIAVLVAEPVQEAPAAPPVEVSAPADTAAQAVPATAPVAAPAAPQASSAAPELADPLADPATAPASPPQIGGHTPGDPLEGFNRAMFGVYDAIDRALYRPVALGYKHVVPRPVRSGVRNFFSNLTEPVVFLNYLLQLRIGKAARTLARFTLNTTFGLGGVIDLAGRKNVGLSHHDNTLGDTLAYYGVGPGPYLFLPFLGPTTLRDLVGGPPDAALLPTLVGVPFDRWYYTAGSAALIGLDQRAEADPDLRALYAGAVDRYATLRSVWLQNRAAEIAELRQHHTAELEDPLRDPAAAAPSPKPSDARELQDPLDDPAVPAKPAATTAPQ
jgi:phospholipid-binding lipoprotein MlaA